MIWIFFHGLMSSMDLYVLWGLRRQPSAKRYVQLFGLTWLVMLSLTAACTLIVGDDPYFGALFMALGALAQGIFVHGALLLVLGGACLLHTKRSLAVASLALGLTTLGVGCFAFWIEPTRLEVNLHRVESAKLDAPMRLVVLSDLQLEELGAYEQRAIRTALALEPDVLLLPGDFIHVPVGKPYDDLVRELNAFLRELNFGARLGVLAVAGNVDRPGWQAIFEGLAVTCFEDSGSIEWGGVRFRAVDFEDSGRVDLRLADQESSSTNLEFGMLAPEGPFRVACGHRPDFALGCIDADLLVAGHTHGGQVVLPFLGPPIILSAVPRAWAAGRTELSGARTLFVSRGVGLERGYAPQFRFGCPPEILVIDLVPDPKNPAAAR